MKTTNWFLTTIKYVLMAFAISAIVYTLSYGKVGFNRLLAKLIGYLPEAVTTFCNNCLEAIG